MLLVSIQCWWRMLSLRRPDIIERTFSVVTILSRSVRFSSKRVIGMPQSTWTDRKAVGCLGIQSPSRRTVTPSHSLGHSSRRLCCSSSLGVP